MSLLSIITEHAQSDRIRSHDGGWGESSIYLSKMKESSHILQVRRNIQEGGCVWNSESEPGMTSVLIYKSYFHI